MTAFALALILAAAFIHASWNYFLKRSGGGTVFVWLFATLSALIYAPLAAAIIWWQQPEFGWVHYGLMFASAALHTAYYLLLDRGYRSGDLSVVYPLARGTGPLITMLCAVLLLQEQPDCRRRGRRAAHRRRRRRADRRPAQAAAVRQPPRRRLRAAHRLHDRQLHAGGQDRGGGLADPAAGAGLGGQPRARGADDAAGAEARSEIGPTWRRAKKEIIAVAVLCPLSYILVLTAMVFTPVSYVAPAREVSILVAALMGTHLLAEGDATRRLAAAAAMVAGIVCLALG